MIIKRNRFGMQMTAGGNTAAGSSGDASRDWIGDAYAQTGGPGEEGWLSIGTLIKYAQQAISVIPVVGAPIATVIGLAAKPLVENMKVDKATFVAAGRLAQMKAAVQAEKMRIRPEQYLSHATDEELEVAVLQAGELDPESALILGKEVNARRARRAAEEAAKAAAASAEAPAKSIPILPVAAAIAGFFVAGPIGAALGVSIGAALGGRK